MFRFPVSIFLCLAMAGCVAQPGDELKAAAVEQQPDLARPEPITKVGSPDKRFARAPLPPKRPQVTAIEVADAAKPTLEEDGQSVVAQAAPSPSAAPATAVVAVARPVQVASLAPIAVTVPAAVQAFAPAADASARPPITRAASTPGQAGTSFDRSTRAYGYLPPLREEEGLRLTSPQDSRFAVPQTVRRSTTPGQLYFAAYTNTEMSCFPQALREALNTIAEHYGKEVEVTSGLRHGGRRGSFHRKCMAADIRVPGVEPGALAAFARTIQGVNGVGTYRHNNVTHVDIREYQVTWRY